MYGFWKYTVKMNLPVAFNVPYCKKYGSNFYVLHQWTKIYGKKNNNSQLWLPVLYCKKYGRNIYVLQHWTKVYGRNWQLVASDLP